MTIRIACFLVQMFPLAARLRSEPELLQEGVVVTEGNGSRAHVVAATRSARKRGITPGMSLPQARAMMPKVIARARDTACENTAQEALLEVAESFSPRIEDAGEGVVYLDVTGMEIHFREAGLRAEGPGPGERRGEPGATPISPGPAFNLLGLAAIRAADSIGLPIRVGIAGSKLAARVAAELPHSPVVVASGEEAAFLAPLPLERLTPAMEAAAMLQRWGLSSIGDLAKLAEGDVASRLGELGRELHIAARGIDPRPLTPRALPPEFREAMEIEWPLTELEQFAFVANGVLDRLMKRLEVQGFACKTIELTLGLDPDGFYSRAIELPAPTRDVKTILTLLRLDLEKTPPGAPVTAITLTAHPDRPRRAQLSLFGPAALSPEKLATTIARLVSLLGDGRVGMAITVDGHLPERCSIAPFDPPAPPTTRTPHPSSRSLAAIRVFRPPVPADVVTRPSGPNEPGTIQIESIKSEIVTGRVTVSSGPWTIQEGWWREAPVDREYWDVEVEGSGGYRLYLSSLCGCFLDGKIDG